MASRFAQRLPVLARSRLCDRRALSGRHCRFCWAVMGDRIDRHSDISLRFSCDAAHARIGRSSRYWSTELVAAEGWRAVSGLSGTCSSKRSSAEADQRQAGQKVPNGQTIGSKRMKAHSTLVAVAASTAPIMRPLGAERRLQANQININGDSTCRT
jgi:hypothetical protein